MNTEKLTTIARPYATAAFEYALAKKKLAAWEAMLQAGAQIARDETMNKLLQSPQMTHNDVVAIFCELLADKLDEEQKNFINLLAEYDRLQALPEIAELFANYHAQHDKTMTVEISSAVALSKTQKKKFADALSKRLNLKVSLECKVDQALLGGAIIRAGDTVIDGSIRGKLNRLIDFI